MRVLLCTLRIDFFKGFISFHRSLLSNIHLSGFVGNRLYLLIQRTHMKSAPLDQELLLQCRKSLPSARSVAKLIFRRSSLFYSLNVYTIQRQHPSKFSSSTWSVVVKYRFCASEVENERKSLAYQRTNSNRRCEHGCFSRFRAVTMLKITQARSYLARRMAFAWQNHSADLLKRTWNYSNFIEFSRISFSFSIWVLRSWKPRKLTKPHTWKFERALPLASTFMYQSIT